MKKKINNHPDSSRNWKAYALSLESQLKSLDETNKQIQDELAGVKEEIQLVIEKAPTAIYEIDFQNMRFGKVNDAMCLISEYSREELLAMSPFELLDEASKQKFQERVRKNLAGEPIDPKIEYKVITKSSREFYVVLTPYVRFQNGEPHTAFVIGHDITERKVAEVALRESEERERLRAAQLEAVLEALPVGVAIIDSKGGNIKVNNAYEQVWGSPRPKVDSVDDYQSFKAWWADTGKEVAPEEWASARAVQAGETVIGQVLEIQRFDGSRAYVHNSASPVRDNLGQIVGSAVAIQDITRLRQAEEMLKESNVRLEQNVGERTRELKQTNERAQTLAKELEESLSKERHMRQQLVQSEKYAALARLVASVAHEINNPLQTIQNCIYLLTDNASQVETQEVINIICNEANRMRALVQQLRETYRPSKLKVEDFDLVDILSQALKLVAPQLRERSIKWRLKGEQKHLQINGVPDQIKQVIINILLNAIDAMEIAGGRLDVSVVPRDGQACITFRDTGMGIEPEHLEKIFEPFYTTKAKGTGLGLAISYEIIRDHQGTISVESVPGKGSSFYIYLPLRNGLHRRDVQNPIIA
jgi:PAS domain S-box-containing protein